MLSLGFLRVQFGFARLPQGLNFAVHDHQDLWTLDMTENLGASMLRANPLSTIAKFHLGHTLIKHERIKDLELRVFF